MNIEVCSKAKAENTDLNVPYVVISITDPTAHAARLAPSQNRKGILRLVFSDIEEPAHGLTHFSELQARSVVEFVEHWKNDVNCFLIHSEAGVSRARGAAVAVAQMLGLSDNAHPGNGHINQRVVHMIADAARDRHDQLARGHS